jgi:cytochrome c oxidase assembly factor CtaG
MLQHILLLLIVPLLLLIGIPPWLARRALRWSQLGSVIRVLKKPLVAWLSGIGAMWVWHVPSLFNAASGNEALHIAQILSLLVMGAIFWLPVFAPLEEWRLTPPFATLYLFSACIACTTLGIIITFAGVGLYSTYLNPSDIHGILPFLRNELYITPKVDQQIGGLIMWVPCCLIYLCASMITIARWYKTPEREVISSVSVGGGHITASRKID